MGLDLERVRAVERAVHEGKIKEMNGVVDLVKHLHQIATNPKVSTTHISYHSYNTTAKHRITCFCTTTRMGNNQQELIYRSRMALFALFCYHYYHSVR